MDDSWRPWRAFPQDLVWPERVGSGEPCGLTRGRATGPRWRRTSPGLFVPVAVPRSPEQRIIEVAAGLRGAAMVTGWAALRVWGGGFFDGLDSTMRPMPVPVLVDHSQRPASDRERTVLRDRALPRRRLAHGIPCASPERALLDAMRLATSEREAVVAIDMALAAGLTTWARVRAEWEEQPRRVGAARVRFGLAWAQDRSRSPWETRLRLLWVLDAGLPTPLVNREVRRLDGRPIGVPDLLDPGTGLVAEYDGALHRDRSRHRRDNTRRERFVEAGLEPVTVVAGDPASQIVARLRAAHARAAARPASPRAWIVVPADSGEFAA
jgi:hypothetical protein